MLLRIEFRRVARQAMQMNVLWNNQVLRAVGTGAIDHHEDEFLRMRLTNLGEKCIHLFGIHFLANLPVQFSLQWADGSIDINKLPFA